MASKDDVSTTSHVTITKQNIDDFENVTQVNSNTKENIMSHSKVWNTSAFYHCYGYGGDLPSVLFNKKFMIVHGVPPVLAHRLNAAWYLITYFSSPKYRLVVTFLLVISIYKRALVLRLPWLVYTFIEFQELSILMICTWVIALYSGTESTNVFMFALITSIIMSIRMLIWEFICWITLNDIISDIVLIITRQRSVVTRLDTVQEESSSAFISDVSTEVVSTSLNPEGSPPEITESISSIVLENHETEYDASDEDSDQNDLIENPRHRPSQ